MNSILSFFKNIFQSLGLFKKEGKLVFLGLDNAGKSTLLTLLATGRITQLDPTKHTHSESLTINKMKVNAFDLGGHKAMRKIWREYFLKIDGIVYLVDSSDSARFEESKKEFDSLINSEEIPNVPIVILGNKIDKKEAVSENELRETFGLVAKTTFGFQKIDKLNNKPVELFMCSVVKRRGFVDGLDWLTNKI